MESGCAGWVVGVACGKCSAMKKMMIAVRLLAVAAMTFAAGGAWAQFGGKLVYQIVRPTVVLTMTYYQTGNNVHVEAYSMQVKKGVVDSSTLSVQDTILFDLSKATETHLQRQTGRAIISPYTATIIGQTAYGKTIPPPTVQLVGPDTANGYTCTHYIEKYSGAKPFGQGQREIWVTNGLGNPGILVMGSYLYYTPGSGQLQALNAAGCVGVVVRTKMSGMGQVAVMNLVSVDTKRINPSLYQIPSYYFVIDNSGYAPSKLGVKPSTPPLKTLTPTKQ